MRSFTNMVVILLLVSGCAVNGSLCARGHEQIIEQIVPSSVQIVLERNGQRFRSGSGVAIAARGSSGNGDCLVLTSGHTLSRRSPTDDVYVLFGRDHGPGTKALATVLAHRDTEDMDLALLRAHSNECSPVHFGRPPLLGDPIWVVAYPWGRNMTLAGGIVSQVNTGHQAERDSAPRFIVDASVSYGASGGGVFDGQGQLVGLVEGYRTARVSFQGDTSGQYIDVPVPGETYVVPLADIGQFLVEADQKDLLGKLPTLAGAR